MGFKMIKFDCKRDFGNDTQTWHGYIAKLVYTGGHMEISVMLGKPVTADVCKTSSGFFVFFPCFECGLNLCSLFDIPENAGRMMAIFNDKEAVTVAHAINKVGNLLSRPRKRRIALNGSAGDDGDELPF
jgi:hypothetical protein